MDVDVLLLADPELLDGQGAPKEPITLVLGPTRDGADIVWPTGRRIDTRHATVDMLGDIQSWPFDSYTTTVVAQAYSGTEAQTELPMEFAVDGDVQGWHLSVAPASEQPGGLFFSLDTGVLALILCGIIFGATLLGLWIGRRLRQRGDTLREPLGVLQGSFLGVVGLVLAFGLALAVGRYEERRAVVVDDANAIGTAYLRAQTLPEPIRLSSLQLLTSYTDAEIALSDHVPGSDDSVAAVAVGADLQQRLWTLAGQALQANPNGNASRLYVESLNEVINLQTGRRRCDTPQHSRGSTARDHLRTRRGLA